MKTNKCNHIIGLFIESQDECSLITLTRLKYELEEIKGYNEYLKEHEFTFKKPEYKLKDFADFRKNVCMDRFIYCPYCGEKLNWKEMCK